MRGYLITFEGIDCSGKTTQAELLYRHFLERGLTSHIFREPGGTEIGEQIRSILLDASYSDMTTHTELFLYLAARAQITAHLIKPALENGDIVIMDRYSDSSTAYQGYARGLGCDVVQQLNATATGGIVPDITFVLDCDPAKAHTRSSSEPDRLESEGLMFMKRVREGFLHLCGAEKDRFVLIDGEQSIETIEGIIIEELHNRFNLL